MTHRNLIYYVTVLSFLLFSASANAMTGKWRGELKMGAMSLPLVFNFQEERSGETIATMDSPHQNAYGIPLEIAYLSLDSLYLECKKIGASFSGKINGTQINGIFSQSGFRFPLTLSPEKPISSRRPQTPKPPFPYVEKDTSFLSFDGTRLCGTLTIPTVMKEGETPIIVMLTGSGPQNRDEEIFEHRPFAVISDFLARNDIASFRFDDRGVASSEGNYTQATIGTFKEDAQGAFRFIKGLSEFGKKGILGHSEGGTLAVMIAPEEKPDFIISLAGMVVPAKEALLAQNTRLLDRAGMSGNQREDSKKLIAMMFDEITRQSESGTSAPIDIDLICKSNSLNVPTLVLESVKRNLSIRNGYFDSLVSLDPTESLKKVGCKILALNGTKDTQVDSEANLNAFEKWVRDVEVKKLDGLNHLFQHANTGETEEYNTIKETISPEILEIIRDFISRQ